MKALLLLERFPACGFRYFDLAVGLFICYFGFTKLLLDVRINLSHGLLTSPIFFFFFWQHLLVEYFTEDLSWTVSSCGGFSLCG